MAGESPWTRWRRLGWADRLLLAEALATVALASLAIALLPFRRLAGLLDRIRGERPMPEELRERTIRRCRWAVQATASRMPWRAVCFQRGMALHFMLRRRGIATTLHYGLCQDETGLSAHVWINDRERVLIGGEVTQTYTAVTSFPRGGPGIRSVPLGR